MIWLSAGIAEAIVQEYGPVLGGFAGDETGLNLDIAARFELVFSQFSGSLI